MELHDNQFKIMIWYDNEWSYSSKIIQLLETMIYFKILTFGIFKIGNLFLKVQENILVKYHSYMY